LSGSDPHLRGSSGTAWHGPLWAIPHLSGSSGAAWHGPLWAIPHLSGSSGAAWHGPLWAIPHLPGSFGTVSYHFASFGAQPHNLTLPRSRQNLSGNSEVTRTFPTISRNRAPEPLWLRVSLVINKGGQAPDRLGVAPSSPFGDYFASTAFNLVNRGQSPVAPVHVDRCQSLLP